MSKKTEELVKPVRIILAKLSNGEELRVTLKPGSRITFAPNVPGPRGPNNFDRPNGYAIRIYEGKGNDTLVAVFTDVTSFRDVDIPVSKLVIREEGKTLWKSDENGYEVSTAVKKDRVSLDETPKLLGS